MAKIQGPFTLSDFKAGDRIELHPATDMWMRGARFGAVEKTGRKALTVRLDALPRRTYRVTPDNVGAILEG